MVKKTHMEEESTLQVRWNEKVTTFGEDTLKVRASLLCGCLQMTSKQKADSRARMPHTLSHAGWALMLHRASTTHSSVKNTPAGGEQELSETPHPYLPALMRLYSFVAAWGCHSNIPTAHAHTHVIVSLH